MDSRLDRAALTALLLVAAYALTMTGCGDDAEPAPADNNATVNNDVGDAGAPDTDVSEVTDDAEDTERCEPGQVRCVDTVMREICEPSGLTWRAERCAGGTRCDDEAQDCAEVICEAGALLGCAGETSFEVCNETGTRTFTAPCPGNSPCTNGACEQPLCTSGTTRCVDLNTVEVCNDIGLFEPQACGEGKECADGECQDLCTLNEKLSSYIGCEYWSLDLDNYDDAIGQPHAIVVSNPNDSLTAEITITRPDGTPVMHDGPDTIEPLGQGVYLMPSDSNISVIEISDYAFVVTSNIPVTAHQFNPLNNVDVFSNDGTLLLPTNTLGREYLVMSWEQRTNPPLRGFLTVANTSGQTNNVQITVPARTAPGPDIPRMEPGERRTFTMAPGKVLNLATAEGGDDLTGTEIIADLPVAAFGGHECANVLVGIDRCDHIESQLFPVNTWGTRYVGTKFAPRGQEDDVWRIMASQDNTVVTFDPPPLDMRGMIIDNIRLDRGEFFQFEAGGHFVIESTAPVGVAHYMVGSNWFGIPRICDTGIDAGNPTGIGDPALTITVPESQFRADYIVLTPLDYDEDYVNVTIREGTTVLLDGEPLPAEIFEPVSLTQWRVAQVRIDDGPHTLTADQPFGLVAYGYDCHVSYAYPGGLNLESADDRANP